jgi:hypothetical protein
MDEDPSNEAFVISLLEGYGVDEAEAMDVEPAPSEVDWRDKYIAWMDRGELPSDRFEARRIARMTKSFTLVDGELYKRAASGILQQCVPIPQGRELLRDIHTGVCGHHAAPRTLMCNAFRQGFYWPAAIADTSEIVRTCKGCQFYARKSNLPAHVLQTIPITWPFAVWGLDIVGPLRKAPGGYTHLLVAIDKFSKWVEVRPITNLRAEQAVTFFTDTSITSECRTPSSPTMGPNSRAGSSWSFATSSTSVWIGQPWRTHRPTTKWSVPTA